MHYYSTITGVARDRAGNVRFMLVDNDGNEMEAAWSPEVARSIANKILTQIVEINDEARERMNTTKIIEDGFLQYIGFNGRVYSCDCTEENIRKHFKFGHQMAIDFSNGMVVNIHPNQPNHPIAIYQPKRDGYGTVVKQRLNGLREYCGMAWWC